MPNYMKMHYSVSLKIVHNFYESERKTIYLSYLRFQFLYCAFIGLHFN